MVKKSLLLICLLMSCLSVMPVPSRREIRNKVKTDGSQIENVGYVTRASGDYVMKEFPTMGDIRGVVILAAFSDVPFSTDSASINALLSKRYNADGYSENVTFEEYSQIYGETLKLDVTIPGSARDYFRTQSSGKFTPSFDVIGPIKLDHPRAYYGANNSAGNDKNTNAMIREACQKVYSLGLTDFSDYDNDGDGEVDFVHVVFAGSDEAQTNIEDCIWSKASSISLTLGGMRIGRYACSGELLIDLPVVAGIGTFVHEFSHILGLPDFYNTIDTDFTIDTWSVMDYGMYNAEGFVPCDYTAFEKYSLGWLPMEELVGEMDLSIGTVEEEGRGYRVFVSDDDTTLYYVLETIRKEKWNKYAPAEGLLITQVDYLKSAWENNRVNVGDNHRYYVVPANNKYDYRYLNGQLYGDVNHSFTQESVPASVTSSGVVMNKPLTEIYYTQEKEVTLHFEDHGDDVDNDDKEDEEAFEEVDVTMDYIVNPAFSYAEWNSGWETTTGAINNQLNTNRCDGYYMTGYYWENWNWTPFTGKMYQTLYVPNGVYRLSMAAFATWEPNYDYIGDTYVYANTSMTKVGDTDNYSVDVLVTDGVLEIGLGMPTNSQNWVGMDNVKLTYLGEAYDTYLMALRELAASARSIIIDSIMGYDGFNIEAMDQINLAVNDVEWEWNTFQDLESIETAYRNVSDAIAAAMMSYHKYKLLYSAFIDLGTAIECAENQQKIDEAWELYHRIEEGYYYFEWGNEEIDSLIEEIRIMCATLKVPDLSDASDDNPIDVTGYIKNPKYEEYNTDWTGSGWLMNVAYHNVEFYNENFYYYQTLTGLPDGMYKVDVQGYYRPGITTSSYNLYQKGNKTKLHAKLFAETSDVKHTTYLQSIISDASRSKLSYDDVRLSDGSYVPNTMGGAYEYFLKDLYHNYIYVYVTGGVLTIGLEKESLIADDWTIFTNWSLTYYGEESRYADGDASGKYTIKYTVDGKEVYRQEVAPNMVVVPLEEIPEKEGYTFVGWEGEPDTMPREDVIVAGRFTTNSYLVTYSIDGVVVASDSIEYGEKIVVPEVPVRVGYTFNGWGEVPEKMPAMDLAFEGDYSINYYELIYMLDDEVYKTDSLAYGEAIVAEPDPVREGCSFNGWSEIPDMMPANDVVVRGTFTANKYLVTFKIGDVVIASDSLEYGTEIVSPNVPVLEGYTFKWFTEVAETVPASDVTYVGGYVANVYKVYYFVGTTLVHFEEVAYGEVIPEYIYEPTTEGDVFEGWLGETYETMPAHDVTYTANITNGVLQVTKDNAQMIVYDLLGRKIEVNDMRELDRGVYIVNGHKVQVE